MHSVVYWHYGLTAVVKIVEGARRHWARPEEASPIVLQCYAGLALHALSLVLSKLHWCQDNPQHYQDGQQGFEC